jgi:hypothetical protein
MIVDVKKTPQASANTQTLPPNTAGKSMIQAAVAVKEKPVRAGA